MMKKRVNHLEIQLFRFNHTVDYLPYYKHYTISYNDYECIYDILDKINSIDCFSYEEKEHCIVQINNYFMKSEVLISDLVRHVGSEIVIEPVSLYRVTNDLVINSKDYDAKLAIFNPFLSEKQKNTFKQKYKLEYYASNTLTINKEYIGDHSILIADEIISVRKEYEQEIFQILTQKDNGMLYHTSLEERIFQKRNDVEMVFRRVFHKIPEYTKLRLPLLSKSILPFQLNIVQFFKGFKIALYNTNGCVYKSVIDQSRATYIDLQSKADDLGPYTQFINKDFSLKIAGKILLEAKDKSADFLIVQAKEQLAIFDGMQRKIEKIVNRDINIPVITESQFVMLLEGQKDIGKLGFQKHTIKIGLLE